MNPSAKVTLLLLVILGTAFAPGAFAKGFKPIPFVASPTGGPIKTVGLLQIAEPRAYYLGEGASGGWGPTSPAATGLWIADAARVKKHEEYEHAGFSFSSVAQGRLIKQLEAAGYKVVLVPAEREKPYKLLDSYGSLPATGVDAYLDLASPGVGFKGDDPFSKKVGPYVSAFARLVSASTKDVLYQDFVQYGWGENRMVDGTLLDAPKGHVFKKTKVVQKVLMSADKQQALAQLEHGIDVVMRTVVAGFSP
jgi:hypothetical protein